jgi:hypothetical protein
MPESQHNGRPKRLDLLVVNDEADAPSILNPMSGQIFITNQVGKRIMELCDGTRDLLAIVEELTRQFKGVSREAAQRDAEAFLADSAKKGLITWTQ